MKQIQRNDNIIRNDEIENAINKLASQFESLDLSFHKINTNSDDLTSYFPGTIDEDILVCVFKGKEIKEPFHRQDFFFINYALKNSYKALSAKFDNIITVKENECYLGQPYSGYALRGKSDDDIVIVGILIRKKFFFREYLPVIYSDANLFKFFLNPRKDLFSDEFVHLPVSNNKTIRVLFELMILEYADKMNDTQKVLKSMLQTLLLEVSRQFRSEKQKTEKERIAQRIINFMDNNSDIVTLKDIANHFGYHPNYVSSLLHSEIGKSFSEIVLEQRMERALLLLKNTQLSIEDISSMLGYSNHSNFYKAFKSYFKATPREYLEKMDKS